MNIYVANLNYKIQDEQLKEIFNEFGDVASAKVVKDHVSGRSRGFGFVEMPDDSQANQAIERLNGQDVEGKILSVSVAKPRTDKPSNGFRRNNSFSNSGGGGGNRNFNRNFEG
jgi:RNA recognition motif-containing protein